MLTTNKYMWNVKPENICDFLNVRFATYGGEPKEAHRIPLGLPKQTQTHSPTCSLWRAVGICIAFATYGSEPTTAPRMSIRHLWFEEMRWIANPSPLQTYSLPKVANTYGGEGG